jgi:hypothetical protein
MWLLVGGIAAGAVYLLFFRKKKTTHHPHAHPLIEVRSNPRRRRRNDGVILG